MKYRQAIIAAFVVIVLMGAIERWTQRGRILVDPHEVKVGRVSITAVDSITQERLWPSFSFGTPAKNGLFRYSIGGGDDGGTLIVYATDYDPTLSISIEGYEQQSISLVSIQDRFIVPLVKIKSQ